MRGFPPAFCTSSNLCKQFWGVQPALGSDLSRLARICGDLLGYWAGRARCTADIRAKYSSGRTQISCPLLWRAAYRFRVLFAFCFRAFTVRRRFFTVIFRHVAYRPLQRAGNSILPDRDHVNLIIRPVCSSISMLFRFAWPPMLNVIVHHIYRNEINSMYIITRFLV